MAQFQLRPLGIGEILVASLGVYRNRWGTLTATAVVLLLPYAALYVVLAAPLPEIPAAPTPEELMELLSGMAPWLVLRLFIVTVMFAGVIRTVGEAYVGVESSWRHSAAAAINRLPALAVVTVLFYSGTILGSFLFVVPGFFLIVSWAACLPALMIEGTDPLSALIRSWKLISGRRWVVLGILVMASLLAFVASTIVYLVLGTVLAVLQGEFGWRLASEISGMLVHPFIGVVLGVTYLDLRVRKENLDSDWLSLELSATSFDR